MAERRAELHKIRSDAQKNSPNAAYKNPEWLAKRALARSLGGKNGSRAGIPHGYTRESITRARRVHRTYALRIVEKIIAMADPETKAAINDSEAAKEALTTAVEIMRGKESETTQNRLSAARMVLDFTKQKPASKVDATIKRAEDYLDELDDDDKGNAGSGSKPEGEAP